MKKLIASTFIALSLLAAPQSNTPKAKSKSHNGLVHKVGKGAKATGHALAKVLW